MEPEYAYSNSVLAVDIWYATHVEEDLESLLFFPLSPLLLPLLLLFLLIYQKYC